MSTNIESIKEIPFQNISKGTSSISFVEGIVSFLDKYIPEFSSAQSSYNKSSSEEDVTEGLLLFLQRKTRWNSEGKEYPYFFQPETPQRPISNKGKKRRADLGVNINTWDVAMELVYCIEAKRLPTGRVGSEREKEYIVGKGGGISRFKENLHGIDRNGKLLRKNGMIGYIQDSDFNYWVKKINEWIKYDTDWAEDELLRIDSISTHAKLSSTHIRGNNEELELNHFWINIA